MDLQTIVTRYAEAFEYVDANTTVVSANRRTGFAYAPGLHALGETTTMAEADAAWDLLHPGELGMPPRPPRRRGDSRLNYPYPKISRATCDHVFTTDSVPEKAEWAVEAKYISFVGNNGKNNDFGVGKMLSPYLKDRGILHDAVRLRHSAFSRRVAVVMYAFEYSELSCRVAERIHPTHQHVVDNIRKVVFKNGAPLTARPVIDIMDAVLTLRGLLKGPRVEAPFRAWRHPAGGRGTVYGWEIRRPEMEPGFDKRNPM